jgi:uncharacterized protein YegJ (DUF2314 family)
MRFVRTIAVALAICCATGCKNKEKAARREQLIELMHGNTDDPDIAAAIQKSKDTVDVFLNALKSPAPGQIQFIARREFPTETAGKRQILIVNHIRFDGTLLHGKVDDNTARRGGGIPRGGEVSFPPNEVCDWMFNDNGKAAGGYMLRALKLKMTPDEWSKIASQITFKEE